MPRLPGRADIQLWRSLAFDEAVFGSSRPVFVRAGDARGVAVLEQLGVKVPQERWRMVQLDAVALRTAVIAGAAIELRTSPALRPLLDVSAAEIGVLQGHAGRGTERTRGGRGVLVGIIDTGIDLSHPTFLDALGHHRVIAFWDQDASEGPAPRGYGYGRECRAAAIGRGECELVDPVGHGTHVAGIAAGGPSLGGIAPEAKIAVVRSESFTRIADAVSYLVGLADKFDMPLVVNMSVGGQYGPHDGRTPLETFLDDLAGEGRIFVAAAGNDGNDRMHVAAPLGDEPVRVALDGLPWGKRLEAVVELWSSPADPVELTAELWRGEELVASAPLRADEAEITEARIELAASTSLTLVFGATWDETHRLARRTIVIETAGAGGLADDAVLAFALTGRGTAHGWVSQSDYRVGLVRFAKTSRQGWISGDGHHSIAVPASAGEMIAVGAYAVRTEWRSEEGGLREIPSLLFGALAPYSSTGPTLAPWRTGVKPDISAPGSVIVSARAAAVPSGPSTIDADRAVMQGTSMAAPHVAGTIALMLEADPKLTPRQARAILAETARQDDFTGVVPNDSWGAGKLDALAAVRRAEIESRGCAAVGRGDVLAALLAVLALTLGAGRRLSSRRLAAASASARALRLVRR